MSWNMQEKRSFNLVSQSVGTDLTDIDDSPEVILEHLHLQSDVAPGPNLGGLTNMVFEVENFGADALTDFQLLGRAAENGHWFTLLSGSDWGTVSGILKNKIGTLNTLAAAGFGFAYVDMGPLYSFKFRASTSPTEKLNNGTFTGNADNWTINADTGTIAYSANKVAFTGADGTLNQPVASMATAWTEGLPYELRFTVSGYTGGALFVGTEADLDAGTAIQITANGTYLYGVVADSGANGLIFAASGFTGAVDNASLKPFTFVKVRGNCYR